MLERDFAAEAGVGWHGKSTMLLHPELGTWFFLAELLTTLPLEPDEPIRRAAEAARVVSTPARPARSAATVRTISTRGCAFPT